MGSLNIIPLQAPLTLFVWSRNRIVPVRITALSVTEEAFDANLNPIRARINLDMRVLSVSDLGFDQKGGTLYMTYQQRKEQLAHLLITATSARWGSEASHERPAGRPAQHAGRSKPLPVQQPLPRHRSARLLELPDGRQCAYLRRRFLPPAGRLPLLVEHTVSQGDRLDNLAAQYLGDPELAWRICDANNVIHPREAADRPGESLRITLPEGMNGSQDA